MFYFYTIFIDFVQFCLLGDQAMNTSITTRSKQRMHEDTFECSSVDATQDGALEKERNKRKEDREK
jgi:hypothetical protein